MSTHMTERQGDAWTPRVIHRAFHVGDPVRVRGDFDVAELAGATGTVLEIESTATIGIRRIGVDVAELGHVRFLAGDIEHAD
jgi:hypothetical protein